jgi:cytochrome c5
MKSLPLNNWLFIYFALTISLFIACKHEPVAPVSTNNPTPTIRQDTVIGWKCSPDTVYFQYDVLPIFISSCAMSGCHDAKTISAGYQLTDYASIMKKGIVAGKATSSNVYASIYNGVMPVRGSGVTMSQAQKDMIAKWINQGAKNMICNQNFGVCDTTAVKFALFVQPLVQNKCQGCHGATNPSGGIALSNYTEIKASVNTGKFWGSIKYLQGFSPMPKGGSQLSTCELDKINAWIKRGALNN